MNTDIDIDCPWCSGAMTFAAEAREAGDSLACATCSIVVELAPDPVTEPVARAA